jgi:hypothetical protein
MKKNKKFKKGWVNIMNNKKQFKNFLESLKGNNQDALIESVKNGFQACFESWQTDNNVNDYDYDITGGSNGAEVSFTINFTPPLEAYDANSYPILSKLLIQRRTHLGLTPSPIEADDADIDVIVSGTYNREGTHVGNYHSATLEQPEENPEFEQSNEEYTNLGISIQDFIENPNGTIWPEEPVNIVNTESKEYQLLAFIADGLIQDIEGEIANGEGRASHDNYDLYEQ